MSVKSLVVSFFFSYFAPKFGVLCSYTPDFCVYIYKTVRNLSG